MSLDFSQLALYLSAASSIAVIVTAIIVSFQLRQNAKLIEVSTQENKSNIAFSMLERIVSDSFVRNRAHAYEIVTKYSPQNWEGFLDTVDDFEFRNYAYQYELFGQFVQHGIMDLDTMMDAMKYIIVTDWEIMEPLLRYICQAHGFKMFPWKNFEWLAKETKKYLLQLESQSNVTSSNLD